jgi:hypothetical protein
MVATKSADELVQGWEFKRAGECLFWARSPDEWSLKVDPETMDVSIISNVGCITSMADGDFVQASLQYTLAYVNRLIQYGVIVAIDERTEI